MKQEIRVMYLQVDEHPQLYKGSWKEDQKWAFQQGEMMQS